MEALIRSVIKITFTNHLYRWNSKLYRQAKGGPIGLRATGSCARMMMDDWMKKFKQKLEENGIEVWIMTKYVDDVLVCCRNVPLGSYWSGNEIRRTKSVYRKHVDSGMDRSTLTMDILRQIANTITPCLKFTGEASVAGKPIPLLDTEVWVGYPNGSWYSKEGAPGQQEMPKEGATILHRFYRKPMATKLGMLRRSALTESQKVSTAVSEVHQR